MYLLVKDAKSLQDIKPAKNEKYIKDSDKNVVQRVNIKYYVVLDDNADDDNKKVVETINVSAKLCMTKTGKNRSILNVKYHDDSGLLNHKQEAKYTFETNNLAYVITYLELLLNAHFERFYKAQTPINPKDLN